MRAAAPAIAPIAFLLVLTIGRDAAASPTSRLVYVRGAGAESCPDEPEMRRAVATRLGYDPFRPIATTTLTAEVRREKNVFRGRVRLVDEAGVERGARDLESRADDCSDLTTAMALSMSIAIDPLSMMRSQKEAPQEAPPAVVEPPATEPVAAPAPPPPPPGDVPAPPPARRDEASDPPRFALAAGAHVAAGIAPAPAIGFRISGELATRRYSLGLEGRFDLAASEEASPGGRSRTSLAGGALLPCLKVPLAWVCGVALAARVDAESVGVSAPRSDGFLFLGLGGRLVTAVPLPEDFSLRIGGDVLAHPIPFELTLNGQAVHRSSAVSWIGGLAVARIF